MPDPKVVLGRLYRRGVVGVLVLSLAVVTFLGLARIASDGFFVDWWSELLVHAFGWGSYVVALTIAGAGVLLCSGKALDLKTVPWHIVVGIEIVFLGLLGLTHLFLAASDPWQVASEGRGGGYVGAVLSSMLSDVLGPIPAGLVLFAILLWGAVIISGRTFEQWAERLEGWAHRSYLWIATTAKGLISRLAAVQTRVPPAAEAQEEGVLATPVPPASAGVPVNPASAPEEAFGLRRSGRRRIPLPPLKLLDLPQGALYDEADADRKAQVIEQTLDQFGVPARVIEINRGPMVTQFGVEPGYVTRRGYDGEETERKIRVAKIASLDKDLALALAAAPIRIEAPVPGRSIVGIEVPNGQVSVVSLRQVMSSSAFRRLKSPLRLALGEGVAGTPVVADLVKMPHLLIAGATGSGKSICINAIATSLLFQHSPLTLRMVMIDPKRVELARYSGLPHLYGPVESDMERIVGVLRWLVHEMQERYVKFARVGARHLDDYNRHWRVGSQEYLPRVVILIDELADLMLFSPDEGEKSICRLAQMARATGMHLIMATQRPSVDVVTGLIKANFPARIAFTVSSGTDSRVILDTVGAETLLGKGDMLYMAPDASGLVRVQGSFVSEDELDRVAQYWEQWAAAAEWAPGPSRWGAMLGEEDDLSQTDEALERAIEIVRQQGSASASLLQRRMHIGYPRASWLIDEMERRGIIGPAESGGRPREVLDLGSEYRTETALSGSEER